MRAELQIPHSIIDCYKADQRKKNCLERWKLGIEFFTLCAIVFYAIIAYNQWTASIIAVQRELRPYISLDIKTRPWPPPPAIPNRISILLSIANVGKTPAKNLIVLQGVIPKRQSKGKDPFYFLKGASKPIALGPGQTLDLQFGDVLPSTVKDIAGGKSGDDYVAWIKYNAFVTYPPVTWQTQLSQHLNGDAEGFISFSPLDTHNCADEDCPNN